MRGEAFVALLLAAMVLSGSGCHPRTEYDTAGLRLVHVGWDTLRVEPSFVRRTSLSGTRPISPETTRVHVFDASYDTLYAGPAATIALPDRRLGSREPLMVEACGVFGQHTLCQQKGFHASPKRTRLQQSRISFPEGAGFQRGTYDVQFAIERRVFQGEGWERIDQALPAGSYLRAYVEGRERGAVEVPLEADQGRFDLARYEGYQDFRFHLRSMMDRPTETQDTSATFGGDAPPTATVAFEIYAGGSADKMLQPVARTRKEVRRKTRAERRAEAQLLAQQAGREVARRLHEDRGEEDEEEEWEETDVRTTVRDWRFDRLGGRYEMDLRVRWSERDDDDRYTLEGTLEVAEDDWEAGFTGERANDRTVRQWKEVVDGDELPLGRLEPPADVKDEFDPEEQRLHDFASRHASRLHRSSQVPR